MAIILEPGFLMREILSIPHILQTTQYEISN